MPQFSPKTVKADDGYHKGACTLHVQRDGALGPKYFPSLLLGTAHDSWPHNPAVTPYESSSSFSAIAHEQHIPGARFSYILSLCLGLHFQFKRASELRSLRWCLWRLRRLASVTKGSVCLPQKARRPHSERGFQWVTRDISVQTNTFLQPAANPCNSNVSISVGKSIMSETV